MPYSRYSSREIFLNQDKNYKNVFFKNRDIKETFQYDMPNLTYPTPSETSQFENVTRIWHATDTLYNIANEFYGAPNYWWVIAWYNMRATEAEFKVGDQYYVPLPLEAILEYVQ
tara:strand:+ start:340 stop:681 length:342 start_codon:yes stop_codon:yes gene_type:complete